MTVFDHEVNFCAIFVLVRSLYKIPDMQVQAARAFLALDSAANPVTPSSETTHGLGVASKSIHARCGTVFAVRTIGTHADSAQCCQYAPYLHKNASAGANGSRAWIRRRRL